MSKRKLNETLVKMEKWSKILALVTKYAIPLFAVSGRLISSFYFYFDTDLDSEAFVLPFPTW